MKIDDVDIYYLIYYPNYRLWDMPSIAFQLVTGHGICHHIVNKINQLWIIFGRGKTLDSSKLPQYSSYICPNVIDHLKIFVYINVTQFLTDWQ